MKTKFEVVQYFELLFLGHLLVLAGKNLRLNFWVLRNEGIYLVAALLVLGKDHYFRVVCDVLSNREIIIQFFV